MNRNVQIITGVFVLFMIFNVSISTLAGVRQYERTLNIKTNTKLEQFLDKHYPDKIMDIIFSNKKNKTDLRRVKRPVSEKIEMQKVALPTI